VLPGVGLIGLANVLTCLALDCGGDAALSHSKSSPEELARAVLAGLEVHDRGALEPLLVTREGLTRALDRYGGEADELIEIEFTDSPEVYETFTLHFGARLRVRRTSDGREGGLPILDVGLERNGRWKLMNFEK
jgi:hypothetical protein